MHQDDGSGHGGSETEAQPPRVDGHMSASLFFFQNSKFINEKLRQINLTPKYYVIIGDTFVKMMTLIF